MTEIQKLCHDLLKELPEDRILFLSANNETWTVAEMRKEVEDWSETARTYFSDLLRVSRNFLARKAGKMPEYIETLIHEVVTPCGRCNTEENKGEQERYCNPCEEWFDQNNYGKCDLCGIAAPGGELLPVNVFHDACERCRTGSHPSV